MSRFREPEAEPGIVYPPTNPFATRWTRPGAMPFQFAAPMTADDLVRRLKENNWRGAIVGPHGSGKSTLLATLLPALEVAGRQAVAFQLRDGQRRLPLLPREIKQLGPAAILVIDGYEQLGRWQRCRLSRLCRRRGCGLLATSHRGCALPVLLTMEPNIDLVERLIEHYLPSHQRRIRRKDIEQAWQRHAGNLREVFFELYDLFEARTRP